MSKRAHSKYKIDRRMGESIWGRPKSPVNKRSYGPGQHGQRRATQAFRLRHPASGQAETQGLLRQHHRAAVPPILHRSLAPARRHRREHDRPAGGPSGRGGLSRQIRADTFSARQLVSHGHVKVNGRRVTIASYSVKPGDAIELSDKARDMALVLEARKSAERDTPDYIEVDHAKMSQILALAQTGRRALRRADGAASYRRILFALSNCVSAKRKAAGYPAAFLLAARPDQAFAAPRLYRPEACSSPLSNISLMMSQPPTNSPFT